MGSDWYHFPMEAVVDQAGRIVLPKFIRDALGLLPGTKVDISPYGAGVQVVPCGRTARLVEEGGVLCRRATRPSMTTSSSASSTRAASDRAVDTSVAVPLLVRSHQHHAEVVQWWPGRRSR